MTSPTRRDDASQSADFIKKAKELEADGDYSATDTLMGRMAKMKPAPRVKKEKGGPKPAPR